jgi:hypothetical protein
MYRLRIDHRSVARVSIFSHGDRIVPNIGLAEFKWPDRRAADVLVRRYELPEKLCLARLLVQMYRLRIDHRSVARLSVCEGRTYRVLHRPTVELLIDDLYEGGTFAREALLDTASPIRPFEFG